MTGSPRSELGTISVIDLVIIGQHLGRDFIPFPLMHLEEAPFKLADDFEVYARTVLERLRQGDLARLRRPIEALLADADIRVECAIYPEDQKKPAIRIHAVRRESEGYIVQQHLRDAKHIVSFSEVSPFEIGSVVARQVPMLKPGIHTAVTIPRLTRPQTRPSEEDDGIQVRQSSTLGVWLPEVADSMIRARGFIYTDWQPARNWGETRKGCIEWVNTTQGDYIANNEYTEANPLTGTALCERIDRSIAEDAAELRRNRRTVVAR